jgi:tetratricopeptide (TPR) repeat protein
MDSARIQDLKRRVARDPASIAFAQLAEEHRRAGDFEEAVRVSRRGLTLHPEYTSARVTLGRALLALEQYDDAQVELEAVQRVAPDNLSAIRALAELQQRRAAAAAPLAMPAAPAFEPSTAPAEARRERFDRALASLAALALDIPAPTVVSGPPAPEAMSGGTALTALEAWLDAILADRVRRRGAPVL